MMNNESTAAPVEPIEVDGYLIDPETGEVVGHVDGAFQVDDLGSAEWVMEKMLTEDIEIAALEKRLEVIAANLDSMKKDRERRRKWLEYRFGDELEDFARQNLPEKGKTWKCAYGRVSFRTTNARVGVNDETLAINFLRPIAPDAIKTTEKVLVSALPEHIKQKALDGGLKKWGFEVVPGGESVTIKTGVEK